MVLVTIQCLKWCLTLLLVSRQLYFLSHGISILTFVRHVYYKIAVLACHAPFTCAYIVTRTQPNTVLLTCSEEMVHRHWYWIAVALLIHHSSAVLAQDCEDPFACFQYAFGACSDEDWPANRTDNSEEEGFVYFPP